MEILKSRLTSVFQRKLKKQPGIKLHVYKRCGGVVWGFGFCFGNPHENFVPTEPLPSLSLRQRWWFDCNIFRFFSYPPLFCGFCIYYQYLSQLLNFMKSPETTWNLPSYVDVSVSSHLCTEPKFITAHRTSAGHRHLVLQVFWEDSKQKNSH